MVKKGFLFTILSVVLISLLFILMTGQFALEKAQNARYLSGEASIAALLITDISQDYVHDILAYGAKETLLNVILELNESDEGLFAGDRDPDVEYSLFGNYGKFLEAYKRGLIEGKVGSEDWDRMENTSLNALFAKLGDTVGSTMDLELEFRVVPASVQIYHLDPMNITVRATILMDVRGQNIDIVNRVLYAQATIPIEGMPDPYLLVKTGGTFMRNITFSERTFTSVYDFDDLVGTVPEVYVSYVGAPSYLQRFSEEVQPNAHNFGIESIINLNDILALAEFTHYAEHPDQTRPFIDHALFSGIVFCTPGSTTGVEEYMYYTDFVGPHVVLDHRRMEYYTGLDPKDEPLEEPDYMKVCS